MSTYRDLIPIEKCARCGDLGLTKTLHVHHKDGNHKNDDPNNLLVLCSKCHRNLHYGKWKLSDIGLEDVELPMPPKPTGMQPLRFVFEDFDAYLAYLKKGQEAWIKVKQAESQEKAILDGLNVDFWK